MRRILELGLCYEATADESENSTLYVALRMTRDSRKSIHNFQFLTPANQDELEIQEGDKFSVAPIQIVDVPLEFVKVVYASRIRLPASLREKKEFDLLYVLLNVCF